MSTPHLEVIPRIIDTSIAASYQTPAKTTPTPTPTPVNESNDDGTEPKDGNTPTVIPYVPRTFTQRFFSTLKDYMVPILFIITVLVVIYIVWKYWTTYRNATPVAVDPQPVIDTFNANKPETPPEDLSRFLLSEDNSDDDNHSVRSKLSTIIENSKETDSQSNDSDNDADDADEESNDDDVDESDNESVVSAPDFSVISNLINQPIDDYNNNRFEYLQDVNMHESYLQGHDFNDEEEEKEEPTDYLSDTKSASSIHTEAVTEQDIDDESPIETVDLIVDEDLVVDEVKEVEVVKPKVKKSKKPKRIVL